MAVDLLKFSNVEGGHLRAGYVVPSARFGAPRDHQDDDDLTCAGLALGED